MPHQKKHTTAAHIPVLQQETIKGLALKPGATVIDATLGSGGYGRAILALLDSDSTYVGIDADPEAIEAFSKDMPDTKATVHLICENFRHIDRVCADLHISGVDAVCADLGWRMEQYEASGKGFSFRKDEPLVMTYGDPRDTKRYPFTAGDIVNEWAEEDIANVLYGYAHERYAKRIARAIIAARTKEPIQSAQKLGTIIAAAVPFHYRKGRIHPATKSFQALRIAVNDECDALTDLITKSIPLLNTGGRIAIVTFHSIEDRIVKQHFRTYKDDHVAKLITKKPLVPTDDEVLQNPRARSAKLRILEKT